MTWAIFSDGHIRAIVELIQQSQSERVTAIVGGALLDDTLRRTLTERLRDDKDIARKLLRVSGPLGNTKPKIDLLYMLGGCEKPVRDTLHGLSQIRNYFAHNLEPKFDSQTKDVLDAMLLLTLHVNKKYYPRHLDNRESEVEIEAVATNRDKFIINLKLCLIVLMHDRVSHVTWSNKPLTQEEMREIREQLQQKQPEKEANTEPQKP